MNISGSKLSRKYLLINALFILLASVPMAIGQAQTTKNNNPYAPSPAGNATKASHEGSPTAPRTEVASVRGEGDVAEGRTRLIKFEVPPAPALVTNTVTPASTDIYRIGINDVLRIKLGNATAGSAYYTVGPDGKIDFPLAGDDVNVKGLTVDEVIRKLKTSIKLFAHPQVEVGVAEYGSHIVTVVGKVGNPGEKNLRREAVPLFVIRAEALVNTDANVVKVTRDGSAMRAYALSDPETDGLLVHPGTSLEFCLEELRPGASYYIAGSSMKTTERPMPFGVTLSKVATAESADAKKATIHRKGQNGKFASRDFDLKAIRNGKAPDPLIESGDIIQVRN